MNLLCKGLSECRFSLVSYEPVKGSLMGVKAQRHLRTAMLGVSVMHVSRRLLEAT